MRLKRLHNDSGMVLVTVVMIVFVMSLLLTAILSQNLSQASVTQAQIDEIKAKQLAIGAFWKAQADMTNVAGNPTAVAAENLDGKTFTVAVDPRPASSAAAYTVTVSY